jgi:LysR family transcriptional regulator, cyn operon transcriptional activator
MNFKNLRAFVATVDAGGVHRAAAALNVSQPAASRQIGALEAELGVKLFDRIGRRLRLTSEGEDMLRRGRRLLAEVEAFGEHAVALKKGDTGILRVAATPQVIENTLAKFLGHFQRRHPRVDVQLLEEGGIAMPRRLEQSDVHFALMAVDDERYPFRLLHPVYGLAVVWDRHRLARRRTIEVGELDDEPLLLPRSEFATRDWFDSACRAVQIRPRVVLESRAPHTSVALASAGYGIAVVPSTVAIPRERVRGIPLVHRGAVLGRWLRLAWHPERFMAAFARQFVDELVAYCEQRYPGRKFARIAPAMPRPRER